MESWNNQISNVTKINTTCRGRVMLIADNSNVWCSVQTTTFNIPDNVAWKNISILHPVLYTRDMNRWNKLTVEVLFDWEIQSKRRSQPHFCSIIDLSEHVGNNSTTTSVLDISSIRCQMCFTLSESPDDQLLILIIQN